MLAAGCSTASTSATTTTKAGKSTATTAAGTKTTATLGPPGSITPTAKDKEACAGFNALKTETPSGGKATAADVDKAAKAVRKAENPKLKAAARSWAGNLAHKHAAKAKHQEERIAAICTAMGLG